MPAVIGEKLNAELTEDGHEVRRGHFDLSRTRHASPRPDEAVEVVGGAGDGFAVARQKAIAGDPTEISHE
jgi:hypothetical protein